MAQQVPQEIAVGDTTYLHTPIGTKDWFTAAGYEGQAEHMWMYNIDASRNAVYFANKATQAVVWTLPDVVAESQGDDTNQPKSDSAIAMKVKGANPSSRWSSANNSPAGSRPGSAMGGTGSHNTSNVSFGPTGGGSGGGDEPSPNTVETTREKLRERLRARLGTTSLVSSRSATTTPVDHQSPSPAHPSGGSVPTATTSGTTESETKAPSEPAGSPTTSARTGRTGRARSATTLSVGSHASSAGSDVSALEAKQARGEHLSAREKLALRRAGRNGTPNERPLSPNVRSASPAVRDATAPTTSTAAPAAASATTGRHHSFQLDTDASPTSANPGPRDGASPLDESPTEVQQQPAQGGGAGAALEKALSDERHKMLLEQDAQLQIERDELIRQERVAIERAKRLQEAQLREQELLLKALTERRAMEERRSELERQRLAKKATSMMASPQQGAGAPSVSEADLLQSLQLALRESGQSAPQLTRQQSHRGASFLSGNTGAHLSTGSKQHHGSPNYSQLEARVQEALQKGRSKGDDLDEAFGDDFDDHLGGDDAADFEEHKHQAASAPVKIGGKPKEVHYSANHSYTGTMYGQLKHGHGLYRYNSSDFDREGNPIPGGRASGAHGENIKPILYEGVWEKNKKHGDGVISLPNSLYEGDWSEDLPHGAGLLQTSNMRAEAKFRKGKAQGGAVVQLKSGASYTGAMKQSKISTPGSIQLTNRDKVEWKWSDPNVAGSGEVVISFANGDHYAGTIRNYVLHGAGYLRFSVPSTTSVPNTPASGANSVSSGTFAGGGPSGSAFHEYSGMFTNGIMEGSGVYKFDSGALYEGSMKAGLFHGVGTFSAPPSVLPAGGSSPGGKSLAGDSPIPGLNKTHQLSLDTEVSPMSTNASPLPHHAGGGGTSPRKSGGGTATGPPAYVYSGEWRQGKMHGRGVITYGNGDVWEGTFSSDRRVDGRYTHSEQFQLVAPSSSSGGGAAAAGAGIIRAPSGGGASATAGGGGGGLQRQQSTSMSGMQRQKSLKF